MRNYFKNIWINVWLFRYLSVHQFKGLNINECVLWERNRLFGPFRSSASLHKSTRLPLNSNKCPNGKSFLADSAALVLDSNFCRSKHWLHQVQAWPWKTSVPYIDCICIVCISECFLHSWFMLVITDVASCWFQTVNCATTCRDHLAKQKETNSCPIINQNHRNAECQKWKTIADCLDCRILHLILNRWHIHISTSWHKTW